MTGEQPRNPGEQRIHPVQPSNQKETNPGQPPRVEGGEGPKLTETELMEKEWSLLCSELNELKEQLGYNLKEILGTEKTGTLEEVINKAFKCIEYIQKDDILKHDNTRRELLIRPVLQISDELEAAVSKITGSTEFSYETKEGFLKRLISLIVKLILNVGNSYTTLVRGRKPEISNFDHPNNALLGALDKAAYAWVDETAAKAKELNNPQLLIDAMSDLLKTTRLLDHNELRSIHAKILVQVFDMIRESVMENRNIDDNLIAQLDDWYYDYNFIMSLLPINKADPFVRKLLNLTPSDLESPEILTQRLDDLARESGSAFLKLLSLFLKRCVFNPNAGLEGKNAGFVELRKNDSGLKGKNAGFVELRKNDSGLKGKNAGFVELRKNDSGLKGMVQKLLKPTGIQTDEKK